ncbi:MAG: surface-adhesin E family protein, partial [Kingella oralis]
IIGTGENVVLYGDLSTRTSDRAWFKFEFNKPQKLSFNSHKFYIQSRTYTEVHCSLGMERRLSTVYYSKNGKIVDSFTPSSPRSDYIIPGTLGEFAYKFVCNHYPL